MEKIRILYELKTDEFHLAAAEVGGVAQDYIKLLPQYETGLRSITHPQKQLQFASSRYLVHHLLDEPLAEIVNLLNGKPNLLNHPAHISISHTTNHVAAIVSSKYCVGIDIEKVAPRILNIKHKFLSVEELEACSGKSENELCMLYWCIKEAVYKWWQHYGVEFKSQIIIKEITAKYAQVQTHLSVDSYELFQVEYTKVGSHYVAWVCR